MHLNTPIPLRNVSAFASTGLKALARVMGGVAGLALMIPVSDAQEIAAPAFTSNATVHDPSVVRAGSTYYVFGSHLASASTTDLMNWTQLSSSVVAGNPLAPNSQTEFSEALTWAQTTDFWAPDVIKLADGRYRFYYCACKGDSPRSALGVAVSDAIGGPYTNVSVILKSGMWGLPSPDGLVYDNAIHPNVVDPSVFFDHAGKLWMVYGSYSGGIFIMTLDATTGLPITGQGYGKKLIGGNNATIEGPYILYSPESAYYYLFVTYGGLDAAGGYNIRMGRSRNPDGPFLDAAGNDLVNVKGAVGTYFDNASIAPYGVKLMGNYQFLHIAGETATLSRGYLSPGGTSAYFDPATGKYLMVFHTRFVGRGEQHEVRVHQLFMNDQDWLVAAPHRYAHETITAPDVGQILGDFKLIDHGKDITATVKTSSVVTFNADHSISGVSTGTWMLSGDHYATLTLGGISYHGVFVRQWDDDNQMWVLAFSALSSTGVSVWGSKVTTNAAPQIAAQPVSQTVAIGQSATFTVVATGTPAPTYQWRKAGVAISGATNSSLMIASVTAADAANYTVLVTNSIGSVISAVAALTTAERPAQVDVPNGDRSAQIVNLSTRGIVSTGEDVLIAGFVVSGTADKKLLVMASGLNLARLGVSGEVGRPHLSLIQNVNGVNVTLAENSDWQVNGTEISALVTQLGAQHLSASSDPAHGDAGVVVTLHPGVYTVVVAPDAKSANQDGVGLIEIYDVTPADGSRLVNISSRGRIETGARQMIVGVVVSGTGHERLMIRAIGPALQGLGVSRFLANPSQTLYQYINGVQKVVANNDDWWNSAQADQSTDLAQKLGAFALGTHSGDSVILKLYDPGVYSAVIAPSDDTPGVALAEIYEAYVP